MCLKCRATATGNIPEMSCVLATGNVSEILPYTVQVPGNVKISQCELSCTFHGIFWPRKFRISSM